MVILRFFCDCHTYNIPTFSLYLKAGTEDTRVAGTYASPFDHKKAGAEYHVYFGNPAVSVRSCWHSFPSLRMVW
jgi:hypothetical protein